MAIIGLINMHACLFIDTYTTATQRELHGDMYLGRDYYILIHVGVYVNYKYCTVFKDS